MILLIDNYDSFSYNLYQLVGNIRPDIQVVRNDEVTVEEILERNPQLIILSPGPGRPEQAGICIETVKRLGGEDSYLWGMPGPSGHMPGLRRSDNLCKEAYAREDFADIDGSGVPAFSGTGAGTYGRALSLSGGRSGDHAGLSGSDGQNRGGRDHGGGA